MKIILSIEKYPIACMCSIENSLLVEKFQLDYGLLPGHLFKPPSNKQPFE